MKRTIGLVFALAVCLLMSPALVQAGDGGSDAAFPQGFLWGTAVSAHSVEGNHTNDWTQWEAAPGHIADGSVSGVAVNHWELFNEDLVWLQRLHANAVLVSLEWSRLEPTKGSFDEEAFAKYRARLETLKAAGIKPIVVLWDFTLPAWEANYGGLENPLIISDFSQYAARVGAKLGDLVDDYITLRDPVHFASRAYKDGKYPPGKCDVVALGKANLMLMGMHRLAFLSLKEADKTVAFGGKPCQVGLIMELKYICAARPDNPVDVSLAKAAMGFSGRAFLETMMQGEEAIKKPLPAIEPLSKGKGQPGNPVPQPPAPPSYTSPLLDYLVVYYKGLEMLKFNVFAPLMTEKIVPTGTFQDDAGQVIYPAGLPTVLAPLKKYPVPLVVMAGIADAVGARRADYLKQTVQQVRAAMLQGNTVTGFFYDSFLDGFEYDKGFSLKKGLVSVNTQIQERKAAAGAETFAALAKSNGASDEPIKLRKPRAPKAK